MHPVELTLEPDLELADADAVPFDVEEVRRCKISAKIARAGYGKFQGRDALMLVVQIDLLPYYDIRFKYVEVQLSLVKAPGQPAADQATIIAYEPKRWEGKRGVKNIQKGSHVGLNTGVATQTMTGTNAGVDVGVDRTVQYAELPRAWLTSNLAPNFVSWSLCENDVTHEGVPKPFLGALIIAAGDQVAIRLKYSVKLSKSANPLSWKSAYARMSLPLILDRTFVGKGIGGDVEHINDMENKDFQLTTFAPTNWDM